MKSAGLPSEVPTTRKPKPRPKPKVTHTPVAPKTDPRFGTCTAAKARGYGPYVEGVDPEYHWYIDRDSDGTVCE
ncbi:excalibur calcium-binding domain-containing protein [Actinomadura graeca]